jgi:serine/threonine protein kinase/Tfp pilus assembly protein PilF
VLEDEMIQPAPRADLLKAQQRGSTPLDTVRHGSSEQGIANVPGRPGDMPEVPGYDLLAELGHGGMGVVYLARQISLKRLVALKWMLNASPTALARFRTEAEAVARLNHPHIVQIHEIGEHKGRPFLSLEYVEGRTLKSRIGSEPLTEREAAQLVETLARAMHHAHQRGILHRDLKPANVLLASADGAASLQHSDCYCGSSGKLQTCRHDKLIPKITDFGLARLVDGSAGPTQPDAVLGTPGYMSPEQATGDHKAVGVASDVYSLGAILYQLLAGQPPFVGTSPLHTLELVRDHDVVPPRRLCRGIPCDLETICLKCLEKNPAARYHSAEDLADDLRHFLEGKTVAARTPSAWERIRRTVRRRPALIAAGAGIIALVCLLGVSGWLLSVSNQLLAGRDSRRYHEFIEYRNEALFHGLLTAEQQAFLGRAEAASHWDSADAAARRALALAEPRTDSQGVDIHPAFGSARRAETVADCYTLLLVRASARARQTAGMPVDRKQLREALNLLDRAAELGIETRAHHLRRAEYLEKLDRPTEASQHRRRARAMRPEGTLDHFLHGEEQCRQGDWDSAIGSFNQALALEPSHFWARFFLAVCQMKLQRWESAHVGLTACLSQQRGFVWAHLYRSLVNERLHRVEQAEADFASALGLPVSDDARYILFLARGIHRFQQTELEKAAADFRAAIELKPNQYNAYLNLAHVHTAQNQLERASEQFAQAVRRQPPVEVLVAFHVERARQLSCAGRDAEATQACQDAQAVAPAHPQPHLVRGHALLRLGRFADAEEAFSQYLRNGGDPVLDVFRARGLARMKLRRFAQAAEDYARVLEHSPDAEIYRHCGWAHFFADAWKLALRDFTRAIELAPENSEAYIGRGLAYVTLGQYREAVADADSALGRRPDGPAMMMNIACIFSLAFPRAKADAHEHDQEDLAHRYRENALDALRRTLAMLPSEQRRSFWKDKILPDPALAPLRRDGLHQVQQEFFPASASPMPDSGGNSP